jgi:hypothetical protein
VKQICVAGENYNKKLSIILGHLHVELNLEDYSINDLDD